MTSSWKETKRTGWISKSRVTYSGGRLSRQDDIFSRSILMMKSLLLFPDMVRLHESRSLLSRIFPEEQDRNKYETSELR